MNKKLNIKKAELHPLIYKLFSSHREFKLYDAVAIISMKYIDVHDNSTDLLERYPDRQKKIGKPIRWMIQKAYDLGYLTRDKAIYVINDDEKHDFFVDFYIQR